VVSARYLSSSGFAADLSALIMRVSASFICATSAAVGRGIATCGGTG
jgi:hypothetical protein